MDCYELTHTDKEQMTANMGNLSNLDIDVAAVGITRRTSRVRLNIDQQPEYSISFADNGTDLEGLSRLVLDAAGNVDAVDSYELTQTDKANMTANMGNLTNLDSDVAAVGIDQRTSRVRLNIEQQPEYSISFADNGTDVVGLSRFVLDGARQQT